MLNLQTYKKSLMVHGNNLSELKRNQSDFNINQSFTGDPAYKRVYILTKEGWKWEDAKYQFHSSQTLDKDPVDYYLQFRPKIHYPVGSYVIVPDDTGSVNLTDRELENPFLQPVNERTQWWIIVDRNYPKDYVRYMILKCDWEFKWIYKNKIMSCWGCARTAKSYTSWNICLFRYYTARCIWKQYSVFLRICWNVLRAIIPKQKDEIGLYGKVKIIMDWIISREDSNRVTLNDYRLKYL